MKFFIEILDFFLPRFCPACDKKLIIEEHVVCTDCLNNIKTVSEDILKSEYKRKFLDQGIISGFESQYVFEKGKELQHIIHSLKYKQRFLNGKFLGKKLGEGIKEKISSWKIDYLVPIPLHPVKKADRGYNQAFYIAKGLGKYLEIPVSGKFIKRKKFTQSQTTMNIQEREENMKNAFAVKNISKIKGKNILLVDDVITTGATTQECARVLLKAGTKKVYAASVAIADYSN